MRKNTIKISCFLLLLLLVQWKSYGQQDSAAIDSLRRYEGQLKLLGDSIVESRDPLMRKKSSDTFSLVLQKALLFPQSFAFPFDSARNISRITSPDGKLRFYTWTLRHDPDSFQYFGFLQVKSPGSTVVFPLNDSSSAYVRHPVYKVLDYKHWYGALYYQMALTKHKKQTYYTLIGWDGHDHRSSRKVIDVLTFDKNDIPRFGAPVFRMYKKRRAQTRVVFEFANDAVMALRYEKKKNIITFENLVPPDEMLKDNFALYLPDGTYDYFRFRKGYWIKNEMLFDNMKNATEDDSPE